MKRIFIKDLNNGQIFQDQIFLVQKFKQSKTKNGKLYFDLILTDKTGEISAKVWEDYIENCDQVEQGNIVKISAEVQEFNNTLQLVISKMRIISDFDVEDFLPVSKYNLDEQYQILLNHISNVQNDYLRKLLKNIAKDKKVKSLLVKGVGAEKAHHSFLGGLVEHINEIIEFSKPVCIAYPEIDRDLLLAGIILHDIGKIFELEITSGIQRTRQGYLIGHIILGVQLVEEHIKKIKGFPKILRDKILHLIISHHGELEFGSPVKPMIIEAVALHFLDQLSSKLNIVRSIYEKNKDFNKDEVITDYSYLMNTRFYIDNVSGEKEEEQEILKKQAFEQNDSNLQIPF